MVGLIVVAWVERSETQGRWWLRRGFPGFASLNPGYGPPSPLVHDLLPVAHQRRQQIVEDAARSGLDLDRHRHAGREVDDLLVDQHRGAVERDARAVAQLLALRLARLVRRAGLPLGAILRLVARNRV